MEIPEPLIAALKRAGKVVALTGAGISAESGVPTFRDSMTGVWAKVRMEDVATPSAFRRDPTLVWNWWDSWKRDIVDKVQPNAGHRALAELQRRLPRFTLVTQNVDGLHQKAGSTGVLELHGSIERVKCFREDSPVLEWEPGSGAPPRCPRCGGPLRHDIVWFEEPLPEDVLSRAFAEAAACEVFLSVGTSTVVYPAAELPFHALRKGAVVVEINPSPTPLTEQAHYVLAGTSGVVLPELLRRLGAA